MQGPSSSSRQGGEQSPPCSLEQKEPGILCPKAQRELSQAQGSPFWPSPPTFSAAFSPTPWCLLCKEGKS